MTYAFENMRAWQEARKLVVEVYRLLDGFPKFESYALCDQIRRAIVSVPSNLAEGSGRISTKEQMHFYEIAYGSLGNEQLKNIQPQIDVVARMMNGLRTSLVQKINGK